MKKSILEPDRYEYLSKNDSILYDKVKDSKNNRDMAIKILLEKLADASRGAHIAKDR